MPVTGWTAAIVARHSARTYDARPLDPIVLEQLESLVESFPGKETARVAVVCNLPEHIFTGIIGHYGRVVGARSGLVIIGNDAQPSMQESAGYLGEAVILEATSRAIDSCQRRDLAGMGSTGSENGALGAFGHEPAALAVRARRPRRYGGRARREVGRPRWPHGCGNHLYDAERPRQTGVAAARLRHSHASLRGGRTSHGRHRPLGAPGITPGSPIPDRGGGLTPPADLLDPAVSGAQVLEVDLQSSGFCTVGGRVYKSLLKTPVTLPMIRGSLVKMGFIASFSGCSRIWPASL